MTPSDIMDISKVGGATGLGVGSWYVEASQALQIGISLACLVYIISKIYFLFLNKGK